ncbi:hypothetical protein L226DRAFT_573756 [Lentinus tigrinus ALCF2SS1-7]|uniref:Uncharacterized protein n=1 Tax=Lentinus tigrinus ALCF2SS1-6 TaxID=1328759 RepID=A0A5C2S0D5_9APHY|nr:hypothetical protein L227DRAFT_614360 [Lentinus tigrinus ALCF2SS1-6]RPD71543.1 hypothetical protein L226DRAFT_573756 [Lentinus tigrinus ALCF2SS1-7]
MTPILSVSPTSFALRLPDLGYSKLKRKTCEAQSEGGAKKRRKTVEIQPFHAELEQAIEVLNDAIGKENCNVKGKVPPGLKPLLGQVALNAVIYTPPCDRMHMGCAKY